MRVCVTVHVYRMKKKRYFVSCKCLSIKLKAFKVSLIDIVGQINHVLESDCEVRSYSYTLQRIELVNIKLELII